MARAGNEVSAAGRRGGKTLSSPLLSIDTSSFTAEEMEELIESLGPFGLKWYDKVSFKPFISRISFFLTGDCLYGCSVEPYGFVPEAGCPIHDS